jgi:sugar O-acyltransferase (sialic acid O-acetyltransferase NeuD family)
MAGKAAIAIAVADPAPRRTIAERLAELDFEFPVLVHPSTVMSHSIEMGEGTIVAAGNILTVGIRIGKHVHINLDCTIGHRAIIEDYSTLFPSVNVSGDVCIRECASIGTGTQIIQDLEIGRNATIGAGSVVVRNVPPDVIAFGNPARVVRKKTP